jgi:hypothetical protein
MPLQLNDELTTPKFWKDLWDHCHLAGDPSLGVTGGIQLGDAQTTIVGFPDKQVDAIFQGQDSGRLPIRARKLVQEVYLKFSTERMKGEPCAISQIAGAFRLLEAVHNTKAKFLSPTDRASLLGAMGMLCRNHGEEQDWKVRLYWDATGLEHLNQAIAEGESIPRPLLRHLQWLAADTRLGAVLESGSIGDETRTDAVLNLLVAACRGDSLTAPRGLYFSCISRLFTLSPEAILKFYRELKPDLHRAWATLSPASMKKEFEEGQVPPVVCGLPFVTGEKTVQVMAAYKELPINDLMQCIPEMLDWHVEDRFAVCILLNYVSHQAGRNGESKVFGWEAINLRPKIANERIYRPQQPGEIAQPTLIHHVRKMLNFADYLATILTVKPSLAGVDASLSRTGTDQAMRFVEQGNLHKAERCLEADAQNAPDAFSIKKHLSRLKVAEFYGEANNAREERVRIKKVLDDNLRENNRYDSIVRAEAYRILARNIANSRLQQGFDSADRYLALAQQEVGAAASPLLICLLQRYFFLYRNDVGEPISLRSTQGLCAWLAWLWGASEFVDGDKAGNLDKYRRHFDEDKRPDQTGPRAFDRKMNSIKDLEAIDFFPAVPALVDEAFSMNIGQFYFSWASGLCKLFSRLDTLTTQNLKNHQFKQIANCAWRKMTDSVEWVVGIQTEMMSKGRALEKQRQLAEVFCLWFKNYERAVAHNPEDLAWATGMISPAIKLALNICKDRIDSSNSRNRRNHFRLGLRKLIGRLPQRVLEEIFPGDWSKILDDCKSNDADTEWYLREASVNVFSVETSQFESVFASAFERDTLEFIPPSADNKDALVQGHAVVNYFLPALANNQGNHGAFCTLQGKTTEHIIALTNGGELLRKFRKASKSAYEMIGSSCDEPSEANLPEMSIPRLLSELRPAICDNFGMTSQLNGKLSVMRALLIELGQELIPQEVQDAAISGNINSLTIVPDGRLFLLPLHLMPFNETGQTLLDLIPEISIKPKASYQVGRTNTPIPVKDIPGWIDPAFKLRLEGENRWDTPMSGPQVLAEIERAGQGRFFVHGYPNPSDEMSSRLSLKDGLGLTVADVIASKQSFENCQIYIFACNSAPQRTASARDLLGLAGAFLTRGVGCVSSSVWACGSQDAAKILTKLDRDRPLLEDSTMAWCDSLREASKGIDDPLERFLRFGCFQLFSGL